MEIRKTGSQEIRKRETLTFVASLLILFQLALPLVLSGLDIITICSAQGVRNIVIDAQGNPVEVPAPKRHCDLCVMHSHGHAFLPVSHEFSVPSFGAVAQKVAYRPFADIAYHPQAYSSRAPPSLS